MLDYADPRSLLRSVQRDGRVETIVNDQGRRVAPSWVGFTEGERLYVALFHLFPALANHFSSVRDSAKNAFHTSPKEKHRIPC